MSKKKGFGKFLAGAALGAGLGLLFAPKTGKETRKELKDSFDSMIDKLKTVDASEVKANIETKVKELKKDIADLDKEKVLAIAKEKGDAIKEKAEDLVDLAKKKGTPVLEKAAEDIRQVAIKATKEVLKKLEATKK